MADFEPSAGAVIGTNSRVVLHLSLVLGDGTTALSTFDEEPLRFAIGDGTLTEGLELGLYGLRSGDEQTLRLDPGQAYGPRDPGNIHRLPRSDFPPGMALEAGMIVGFSLPNGQELAGAILELGPEEATVDFNHPLAGRALLYRVKVLDVSEPATERAGRTDEPPL